MPYQNPYLPMGNQYGQYQPQGYMTAGGTYGMMQQQQQPVHGFVYVTGIEGAKAYQMPPNSEMPLFDSTSENTMFIKTTDGAGFPTIKVCDVFDKTQATQSQGTSEYVTHDELHSVYANLSEQLEQLKGDLYGTVPAATDTSK